MTSNFWKMSSGDLVPTASNEKVTVYDLEVTNAFTLSGTVSGAFDLNGNELTLDVDGDTSITADTDDQIDIEISGADDFQFTANLFSALSGSIMTSDDLDSTTATTLLLGKATATKVEIADSGIETNIEGTLLLDDAVDTSTLLTLQNTDTAIGTAGYLLELIHDSNDDADADFLICQDDGAGTPDTVFSIASDGSVYIGASGNSLFNESISIGNGSASAVDLGADAEADLYITDDLEVDGVFYTASDSVVIETTQTPASNAACTIGEIAWDANYIYICTASTVWKRAALTGGY